MRLWFLALSGTIFLVTLIRPSLFHLANRIWSSFGRLLGKVVNPIITGLLFFLVFTPCAAVLRWMGKDLLGVKRDPEAKTYWIQRSATDDLSNMSNQF
jgi:hypothetical protein